MELFQLRYFAAAAEALNFSRAAQTVCVSQPSLSAQIARLEAELGVALFVRAGHCRGRSVALTDAGDTLFVYATRLIAAHDEARRAVRAVAGLEAGRLRIATLPTAGQHLLPAPLAAFRAAHPSIEIAVREQTPDHAIVGAVAEEHADIGVVHAPTPSALAYAPLLTEELALVVPAASPLVGQSPALAALRDETWVFPVDGVTAAHPLFAACLAAGFTPQIACVSGSASGIQAFVAAGLGIALLPRLALAPPPGAVVVELARPRPTRTLAAIWRGDGTLSHAARAFLDLLVPGNLTL